MHYKFTLATFLILLATASSIAQKLTPEEQAELDALEAELNEIDTTSLLFLLDSLIKLEEDLNRSNLVIKGGYNTESLINDRNNLGTENGSYAGLSYYHKTGLFIDGTQFWNSQYDPQPYLFNSSLGYLGTLGIKFSYLVSYEHYFFNKSIEDEFISFPYTDGLNGSMFFVDKYFEGGTTYSVTFGDATTIHRLNLTAQARLQKLDFWIFDNITFKPGFGILFGNQVISSIFVDRRFLRPRLRFRQIEENVFGLTNISINLPLFLTIEQFNLSVSYQFNLPQELEGEELDYTNSNVFNISLSYFMKL